MGRERNRAPCPSTRCPAQSLASGSLAAMFQKVWGVEQVTAPLQGRKPRPAQVSREGRRGEWGLPVLPETPVGSREP